MSEGRIEKRIGPTPDSCEHVASSLRKQPRCTTKSAALAEEAEKVIRGPVAFDHRFGSACDRVWRKPSRGRRCNRGPGSSRREGPMAGETRPRRLAVLTAGGKGMEVPIFTTEPARLLASASFKHVCKVPYQFGDGDSFSNVRTSEPPTSLQTFQPPASPRPPGEGGGWDPGHASGRLRGPPVPSPLEQPAACDRVPAGPQDRTSSDSVLWIVPWRPLKGGPA